MPLAPEESAKPVPYASPRLPPKSGSPGRPRLRSGHWPVLHSPLSGASQPRNERCRYCDPEPLDEGIPGDFHGRGRSSVVSAREQGTPRPRRLGTSMSCPGPSWQWRRSEKHGDGRSRPGSSPDGERAHQPAGDRKDRRSHPRMPRTQRSLIKMASTVMIRAGYTRIAESTLSRHISPIRVDSMTALGSRASSMCRSGALPPADRVIGTDRANSATSVLQGDDPTVGLRHPERHPRLCGCGTNVTLKTAPTPPTSPSLVSIGATSPSRTRHPFNVTFTRVAIGRTSPSRLRRTVTASMTAVVPAPTKFRREAIGRRLRRPASLGRPTPPETAEHDCTGPPCRGGHPTTLAPARCRLSGHSGRLWRTAGLTNLKAAR